MMRVFARAALIAALLMLVLVPAAAFADEPVIHTVQPGENLFRIGLKYNLPWPALVAANGLPNASVYAGQRLVIPATGTVVTSVASAASTSDSAAPAAESQPAPGSPLAHVVRPGETLFRIATNNGLSVWTLAAANNIANPKLIFAGQVLTIPTGNVPPSIQQAATQAAAPAPAPTALAPTPAPPLDPTPTTVPTSAPPPPTPVPTLVPTLVPTPVPPPAAAPAPAPAAEHWVDVDLTNQRVHAMEGDTAVRTFVVSTGTWRYPTVTGQFRVYVKYSAADMSGPGYYLPQVPWVMYFYRGYGLHGTYWHSNFGTPMSHGCVNLTIPDAEWLFSFASVGTLVNVHY